LRRIKTSFFPLHVTVVLLWAASAALGQPVETASISHRPPRKFLHDSKTDVYGSMGMKLMKESLTNIHGSMETMGTKTIKTSKGRESKSDMNMKPSSKGSMESMGSKLMKETSKRRESKSDMGTKSVKSSKNTKSIISAMRSKTIKSEPMGMKSAKSGKSTKSMRKGRMRGKGKGKGFVVRDEPTNAPTPAQGGSTDTPTMTPVAFRTEEPTPKSTPCPKAVDEGDDGSLQRRALVSLYEAAAGCQWTYSDRWLSSSEECSWFGINCFESTVRSIQLRKSAIVDSLFIPPGFLTI